MSVFGYRLWVVNMSGELCSLASYEPWNSEYMTARCHPILRLNRSKFIAYNRPYNNHDNNHGAPQLKCSCGIHVFSSLRNMYRYKNSAYDGYVAGLVLLSGRIIEHRNNRFYGPQRFQRVTGYRAEHARILAFIEGWRPPYVDQPLLNPSWKHIPRVEKGTEIKEIIARWQ